MLARPTATARPVDERALTLGVLLDAACTATGLHDFGDDAEYLPALQRLLAALRDEAALNATGREVAHARLLQALKNRLWAQACFKAHPEIDDRAVAAPIVIVGPHRSGTTRLHRLLAADPRLAHLKTWEGMNPAPRELPPTGDDMARRHFEAVKALAERRRRYRHADAMHAMRADAPEEEMLLMNHTFSSFQPLGLYDIPGWYRWWVDADKRPAYAALARWLKLVAWARGDAPGRRWVLKNPQHMLDLPALLAAFPDALLVFTHRDPQATVGSVVSMMCHFSAPQTDRDCRLSVRDTWLDFCERAARRCLDARRTLPAACQVDVDYEAMNRDWRAVLQGVYDAAGLPVSPHAEVALRREADALQARREVHRYRLEDFGLCAADVEARMGFVRRAFTIGAPPAKN